MSEKYHHCRRPSPRKSGCENENEKFAEMQNKQGSNWWQAKLRSIYLIRLNKLQKLLSDEILKFIFALSQFSFKMSRNLPF